MLETMELTWASNPANCRPFQQSTAAAPRAIGTEAAMISFEELDIARAEPRGSVNVRRKGIFVLYSL